MTRNRLVSMAAALGVAAVVSPAALASGKPANDQYPVAPKLVTQSKPKQTPSVSGVQAAHTTTPKATPVAVAKPTGTLPFTGLDLAFVAAAGGAAVAGGVGLRKLGRKHN